MARRSVKINVSGSWASLAWCEEENLAGVKRACEAIAAASIGRVAFKVNDASGRTLEEYASIPALGKPRGWKRSAKA
jgi:hypothetical protein